MRPESGPPDLLWSARQDSNLHSLTTRICNPLHNHSATCTNWLGRQDSNLRYTDSKSDALPLGYSPKFGGLARIRTEDQLIKSQLLYQLSYESMVGKCGYAPLPVKDEFYRLAAETIRFTSPWLLWVGLNYRPKSYQLFALPLSYTALNLA
jgi:hypothetical protein